MSACLDDNINSTLERNFELLSCVGELNRILINLMRECELGFLFPEPGFVLWGQWIC
jgi:hypothetical protein